MLDNTKDTTRVPIESSSESSSSEDQSPKTGSNTPKVAPPKAPPAPAEISGDKNNKTGNTIPKPKMPPPPRNKKGVPAPKRSVQKSRASRDKHASRGRHRERSRSRRRHSRPRHSRSRKSKSRRRSPLQLPLPQQSSMPRPAIHNLPPDHPMGLGPSPGSSHRGLLLSQAQRASMELLMKEIENAVSLRTEFSTMEAVDIRRAARILVSNGIPTLGEFRITPRRNRDYLMEDLRRAGYSGWW